MNPLSDLGGVFLFNQRKEQNMGEETGNIAPVTEEEKAVATMREPDDLETTSNSVEEVQYDDRD